MRHMISKPILGAMILVWILMASVILWSPADSIRETGREVRKATASVAPSMTARQLLIFDGDNWHLFLFLGLAVLLTCYPHSLRRNEILMLLVLLTAYSTVTEIVQEMLVPGRAFEWQDMGRNQVALTVGVALTSMARLFISRQQGSRQKG
jgi:hypothetical protein